jgi:hypothetical protein
LVPISALQVLLPAQLAATAVPQAPHSSAAFKPTASAAISGAVFAAGSGGSRQQQQQQQQTVLAGRPLDVPTARGQPSASLATAAAAAATIAGASGESPAATGSLQPAAVVASGRTVACSEQQQQQLLRHDVVTLGVLPPLQVGLTSNSTCTWRHPALARQMLQLH